MIIITVQVPLQAENSKPLPNNMTYKTKALEQTKTMFTGNIPTSDTPFPDNTKDSHNQYQNNSMQTQEIQKNLMEIYTGSWNEINDLLRFVGFGILIAIFYMGSNFRTLHRISVLLTSFLASLSLLLNYIGCALQRQTSEALIRKNDTSQLQYEYAVMIGRDNCLFFVIQFILLFAVVSFCYIAYRYFFYKEKKV